LPHQLVELIANCVAPLLAIDDKKTRGVGSSSFQVHRAHRAEERDRLRLKAIG